MGNRKKATAEAVKWVERLIPGGRASKDLEATLNALSDEEFDHYMQLLDTGEEILSIAVPNLGEDKLEIDQLLEVAKEMGHEFFQQLWLTDAKTGVVYLTPEKYLVLDLPLRRQQQLLTKKISVPDDNRHVDELSGQATGDSKGASLSLPELSLLRSQGLDRPILEMIKVRGGDHKAFQRVNREIIETGEAALDPVLAGNTRVKSTETLSTLLKAAHLNNNL